MAQSEIGRARSDCWVDLVLAGMVVFFRGRVGLGACSVGLTLGCRPRGQYRHPHSREMPKAAML